MSDERTMQDILSTRLKEAREYRGFSQEDIARYLRIPRSAISLIENGSRRVSATELSRLASLYQTTMESPHRTGPRGIGARLRPYGGSCRRRSVRDRPRRSVALRTVPAIEEVQ